MRVLSLIAVLMLSTGLPAVAFAGDTSDDATADDDFLGSLDTTDAEIRQNKPKETLDNKVLGALEGSEEDIFAGVDMAPPAPPPTAAVMAVAPKGPGPIPLEVTGKKPLSDNYELQLVHVDRSAVVVELPVLVAAARASVTEGFQIVGEVWIGDQKITTVSQKVEPASLAEYGPSFVFLKALVPVATPAGAVSVVVKRAKLDGTGAAEIFRRSTDYSL